MRSVREEVRNQQLRAATVTRLPGPRAEMEVDAAVGLRVRRTVMTWATIEVLRDLQAWPAAPLLGRRR